MPPISAIATRMGGHGGAVDPGKLPGLPDPALGGETRLLELRLGERLIAVAVTDRLPNALSAVYTFFDPAVADRAPGAYAILSQVGLARRLGLQYLYLGYWIQNCRKMAYKDRYRPIQALIGEQWQEFERGQPIPDQDG